MRKTPDNKPGNSKIVFIVLKNGDKSIGWYNKKTDDWVDEITGKLASIKYWIDDDSSSPPPSEARSKEEILAKITMRPKGLIKHPDLKVSAQEALEAMDEYANQFKK